MPKLPPRPTLLLVFWFLAEIAGCSNGIREGTFKENGVPAATSPTLPGEVANMPGGSSLPNGGGPLLMPRAAEGVHGILGCPTAPLPAYGNATAPMLSEPYARSCAACHGGAGEGQAKYPSLPGALTESEFISKVRVGKNAMPAFGPDFVSDAQLSADFANLKSLAGQTGGIAAVSSGPSSWSAEQVEHAYHAGLAVWRKPGSIDGQACTNCHSPDGVELAIIGFTDDSILRRAQQHLSAEDALTVRDFVHAQRLRLRITEVCSTDWRPFQPGGQVLAGANPEQQDGSFLKVLEARKLLVATGKIVTNEDAKRAFAELQGVDLRQLPSGIPLPRFSEDKFNGPEHRDINDYMPPVPTVPNDRGAFFAAEDEYLANPSDAGLYRLLDENRMNTHDLGYSKKYAVPSVMGSNCGSFPDSTSWITTRVTQPKRLNVLVTAHLFREEIKHPGAFYARSAALFADAPQAAAPAFFLGGFAIEPPCYDALNYPSWIQAFPAGFRDEFPEEDLMRGVVENATDRMTHPWMTLGQILDPTLISTDNMQTNKIHYWAFRNFKQRDVHLPFMYVQRMASQTTYWSKQRGTAAFPKTSGPFDNASRDWLEPILANQNQQSAGLQSAVSPDSTDLPAADVNRFKGNLIRTLMLLSRELLQAGTPLQTAQNYDHCLSVICQTEEMYGYVNDLKKFADDPTRSAALAAQGFDMAFYETETRKLLDEVVALMKAAPKRD